MIDLDKEQHKMELLLEKRGVAGHPWKQEIDKIFAYIRDYIKEDTEETEKHKTIHFYLPEELTNVFTFLGDLEIEVEAMYEKYCTRTGGGQLSNSNSLTYSNDLEMLLFPNVAKYNRDKNKIYHKKITIQCIYGDGGVVHLGQIQGTLYHEINHAYDMFISYHKDGNVNRINKTAQKAQSSNLFSISSKLLKNTDKIRMEQVIRWTIYRLFSETEFNALVASVYGDLSEMNSQYTNCHDDYKKTQAYIIYDFIKHNIRSAIMLLPNDDTNNLFAILKTNNIYIPMRRNTVSQFKNGFLQKTEYLLSKLIKEIGRTASLWYEDEYDKKISNNGQAINPPVDEPLDLRYFK